MIYPAPTSKIDPVIARGVLSGVLPATATKPACIRMAFPDSNYDLHLAPLAAVNTPAGKRLMGRIIAQALRIDRVKTGGRFVEPVYGRPRRVQGRVIATAGDRVVVDAGMPIHCEPTHPGQKASDFEVGDLVAMDVRDGAAFQPQ